MNPRLKPEKRLADHLVLLGNAMRLRVDLCMQAVPRGFKKTVLLGWRKQDKPIPPGGNGLVTG